MAWAAFFKKWRRESGLAAATLLALLLSGCLEGARETASSSVSPTSTLTLVTYDTLTATLLAQGKITLSGTNPSTLVRFHRTQNCADTHSGQGLLSELEGTGITITVPSSTASTLYYSLLGFSVCARFAEHTPNHSAPRAPELTSTQPSSPSRESHTPAIFGKTFGVTKTVEIFDDATCSHLVGSDTGLNFTQIGIQVALAPNHTSTLYAKAIEPFGNASACSPLGSYTHTQLGPAAPVFASILPTSPNNTSTSPTIQGTASSDSVSLKIYGEPSCSTELASGTKAAFTGSGLTINVPDNSTTKVYAKAFDTDGNPSVCAYLTTYTHDTAPPAAPTFSSSMPPSPTNATTFPLVKGVASADTATVLFFKDAGCVSQIGTASKATFEASGARVTMGNNTTTNVYGAALDGAGNRSLCSFLLNYKHNTIPPDPPVYGATDPVSPNNQSTTPFITGAVAPGTIRLNFFKDDLCTQSVGSGTTEEFQGAGVQLNLPDNAITTIYVQPIDMETNVGACSIMTNYAHSTMPAPNPGFLLTLPASPTNITTLPMVVGTAAATVSTVSVFADSSCATALATANRSQYVTTGVQVSVPARRTTSLYARSTDVYGNFSACTPLTQFTHDDVPPLSPSYVSISPVSPNNQSTSPSVKGTVTIDPLKVLPPASVSVYDSFLCINTLGSGSVADFTSGGVTANVPANAITNLHARVFDAAGNYSTCTAMTDYLHNTWPPGRPILASANPASPSYTRTTTLKGTLGTSKSLLPPSLIGFYSDATCQTDLGTGLPASFTGSGVTLALPRNQTTTVYGRTFDAIGNQSTCNFLMTYAHNDLGPNNLSPSLNLDGSVTLTWTPDLAANPTPKYVIKRSIIPGGPYTVLAPPQYGSYYVDRAVSNNTTYYYVVSATNVTGTSLDSSEVMQTVTVGTPAAASNLVAVPGDAEIRLSWSGFNSASTFKVLRATQSGGPYATLKTEITGTNYVDTTVTNNTTYYYIIVAVNPSGESQYSTEANATPMPVGDAPTNLQAALLSQGGPCADGTGMILSWSSPAYYDGFSIRRGISPGALSTVMNVPAGTNTATICPSGDNGDNVVYYAVAGVWNAAESPDSNEIGVAAVPPPTVVARAGQTSITLSWPTMIYATGYDIYRASRAGGPFTLIAANHGSTSFTDPVDGVNVIFGQTAYYYVQALYPSNARGYPSLTVSATPDNNPTAPSNLLVTMDTSKKPLLSWSAPRNFNFFNIYRSSSFGGPYTYLGSTTPNQSLTTFVDSSATAGLWYYQVTAVWGSHETAATTSSAYRHGYPNTITATPSTSDIALSWASVAGAASYRVYRSTSSGGAPTLIASPTTTSYIDSTAAANTGYFYYVQTVFADTTTGEPTAEVSAMRTGGSVVPTGLTVKSTTSSSVTLTWAKVSGATLYKVYRSNTLNGTYTLASSVSTTTALIASGMMSGLTYYFKVSAVVGTESALSTALAATTLDTPFAPTVSAGNNSVGICWQPVTGATSYNIRRTSDLANYTTIVTGASSCTVTDNTAVNGNLYFYTVTAVFPGGATATSPPSSSVTPGVVPLKPNGLSLARNATGTDLRLTWSFVPGATGYQIYQSTTSGSGYTATLVTPVAGNSNILVSGLSPGTTYHFVVSAFNGTLESAYSDEIAVTTAVTPPAPVTTITNNTNVTVTWAPIAGAVAYDLQRSVDGVIFTTLPDSPVTSPYVDTNVSAGVGYYYRYLPYSDVGRTIPMAISDTSSPLVTPITAPLVPSQLMAFATSTTSVSLQWSLVPNAMNYNIYRSSTGLAGSFTKIASVATDLYFMPTSTTDATVSAGNTYYYQVKAANASAVESAASNTVSVEINGAPTGLIATNGPNVINLTWTPFAGASSYSVYRSLSPGGPYGLISSANASTTFSDHQIDHGTTYYYVVTATLGSGSITPASNEASATAVLTMNIQVPIELADQGLSSDTAPTTFERTRTTLDTSYYDGTITYAFEVNAVNSDSSPQMIQLIDSSGASVATIAIAAGTVSPYRSRVLFTPNAGNDNYRVQLPATSSAGVVQVLSARIVVTQTGASKTRLYIPLLASSLGASSGDVNTPVESTGLMNYVSLPSASLYVREMSGLAKLAANNPFELETLVASYGGATNSVTLYNNTKADWVTQTQAYFTSSSITMVRSSFAESATHFDSSNEGNNYSVTIRCEWNCSGAGARLYKAGLWITLTQMSKARVFHRISHGFVAPTTIPVDVERTRIDLSAYTNPIVRLQATGKAANLDSGTVELMSAGTLDQGTSPLNPVAGSLLTFTSGTKEILQTPPLTVTGGDRFLPQVSPTTAPFQLINAILVIDTGL